MAEHGKFVCTLSIGMQSKERGLMRGTCRAIIRNNAKHFRKQPKKTERYSRLFYYAGMRVTKIEKIRFLHKYGDATFAYRNAYLSIFVGLVLLYGIAG